MCLCVFVWCVCGAVMYRSDMMSRDVVNPQVVSHHEDLLSQATGIETLEGQCGS